MKVAPLRNCIGFVDETVRPIGRPTRHQRVCYNGHNRIQALKFQSVVVRNGLIANLYGPIEGRRHDCALFTASGLMEEFEVRQRINRAGQPFALYEDAAYPLRPYLHLRVPLSPVAKFYLVERLLSNCHTCLYGSQPSRYFDLDPPQLEFYLAEV